ncbi:MAG TPA: GC-type dockerin domain-anchored protein [Phycisphaerales bacterium]|nr:GC-type dockerin domain-anchored protein [Phycisphaerales bacterium]
MGAMRSVTAALAVAAGSAVAVGQVGGFVVLPPAGGGNYVLSLGISGDGTTVFGESGTLGAGTVEAYRWTAASGGQLIGLMVSGTYSSAMCSDSTGTNLYGEGGSGGAFAWSGPLPGSVTTPPGGPVLDVSADGAVRLTRTERYAGGSGEPVPHLAGDQEAQCASISADGAAVALTSHFFQSGGGYGYGSGGPDILRDQACRWSAATGTVGCGFLPGTDRSFAASISEDGAVVVGTCRAGTGLPRGFRWTATGGMEELTPAAGQATPTMVEPVDCTADGAAILCRVDGDACVWTGTQGFRSIKQILLGNGLDVGAWTFYSAAGISDDGAVVTGQAIDGGGQMHAWVASLTQPCAGPSSPWTAVRRVIVADGDSLPGGGVASSVSDVTVNRGGAALVRSGGDVWVSPADGSPLVLALAGNSGGGTGIAAAAMNDAGIVAASRLSTLFVGAPPQSENAHAVLVGPPGAMAVVAAHGDPIAPADGGGTLRTYAIFAGPLMSNGGLAVFQTEIDGTDNGQVRCLVHNTATGGPLIRSAPAVSLTAPQLRAVSDGGVVVRAASEGVLAGGPPPQVQTLIAPAGGAAPGVPGGTFATFSSIGVNAAGTVVFEAAVSAPGGTRDALYRRAPGGAPQLLLIEGDAVNGSTVSGITSAQIGSTGSVFASLQLADRRSSLVKIKPDGTVLPAATDGDLAPGTGPCRQLHGWSVLGVDERRVLVSTSAQGPSGSSQVLATWGEEEGLSVLARTGETLTLRPGLSGTVTGAFPAVLGGNGEDGRPHAVRGGHVIYSITLSTPGGPVRAVVSDRLPPLPCGSADVGGQGGVAGADGRLDNNDFVAFIDMFFSADPAADMGRQGGVPGQDGAWDNNDFVVFIDRFFAGCV